MFRGVGDAVKKKNSRYNLVTHYSRKYLVGLRVRAQLFCIRDSASSVSLHGRISRFSGAPASVYSGYRETGQKSPDSFVKRLTGQAK